MLPVSFRPVAEKTMPVEAAASHRVGEANTPSLRLAFVQFQDDSRRQPPRILQAAPSGAFALASLETEQSVPGSQLVLDRWSS